jgi:hypothetical protein
LREDAVSKLPQSLPLGFVLHDFGVERQTVLAPRVSSSAAATGPVVLNRPLVSFSRYGSSFQAT